jgi:uncharacterized protein (TIGR02594 family)
MSLPWVEVAKKEIGIEEIPGPEHNSRILDYHATTTLKATEDEVPWCSSFLNWVMYHAGYLGTRSAAARSWLEWGYAIKEPCEGAIAILRRGNSPTQGHVGIYMGAGRHGYFKLLAGNQGDRVSIEEFRLSDVLGWRYPKAVRLVG